MVRVRFIAVAFVLSTPGFAADLPYAYFGPRKVNGTEEHHIHRTFDTSIPNLSILNTPYDLDFTELPDDSERLVTSQFDPIDPSNLYVRLDASIHKRTASGQELWVTQFDRHNVYIRNALFPKNGNFYYLSLTNGEIHVVSTATGVVSQVFTGICNGQCFTLDLSPDETFLAVGDSSGVVSLIQPASGSLIARWQAHRFPVRSVKILSGPNGNFIVSHDWFELIVRNLDDEQDLRRFTDLSLNGKNNIWIDSFDLIRGNGSALIASGLVAKVLDLRSGAVLKQYGPTGDNLLFLSVSEDETRVTGVSGDLFTYVWDLDSQEKLATGAIRTASMFSVLTGVGVSSDGRKLSISTTEAIFSVPARLYNRVRLYATPGN